jgi:ADP-heptose:LPS heptosyltransferase
VPGEYVCIHPGASVRERRWSVSRFAALARALHVRGLRVVLTGTSSEGALAHAVTEEAAVPILDLVGRTDLGALGVLLARARLLVCNDTGVSHVAAGLRTPSVVISTGDNPARWAPIDSRLHRVLCRDSGVGAEEVIAESDDLLTTAWSDSSERLAAIA